MGTDYNFECQENGILVTSEDSSFVLTDRAKNIEQECKGTVNKQKYEYIIRTRKAACGFLANITRYHSKADCGNVTRTSLA